MSPSEAIIAAAHGDVGVATDDKCLRIRVAGRDLAWSWSSISGAGVAHHPTAGGRLPDLPPEIAATLPGFGSLRRLAAGVGESHEALLIAWSERGRRRSFQLFLPTADPAVQALWSEMGARLGTRWLAGGHDLEALRRQLGVAYPRWFGPLGSAVAAVVVFVTVLPALTGFAALKNAATNLDWAPIAALNPLEWAGVGAWLLMVGLLLARFGRLFRR